MKTSCEKCGSSDAVEVYEDGHEFCFSCREYNPNKERPEMNASPHLYSYNHGRYPLPMALILLTVVVLLKKW